MWGWVAGGCPLYIHAALLAVYPARPQPCFPSRQASRPLSHTCLNRTPDRSFTLPLLLCSGPPLSPVLSRAPERGDSLDAAAFIRTGSCTRVLQPHGRCRPTDGHTERATN